MRFFKTLSLFVIAGMLLAACASQPTPAPSPLSTDQSPQPGGGLITRPGAGQWANEPQAALAARAALVQKLGVDPDTIVLVSAEQVDWPDACLGIQKPGIACAQIISPGYKVILEAEGRQYEYHTDLTGDNVQLASET